MKLPWARSTDDHDEVLHAPQPVRPGPGSGNPFLAGSHDEQTVTGRGDEDYDSWDEDDPDADVGGEETEQTPAQKLLASLSPRALKADLARRVGLDAARVDTPSTWGEESGLYYGDDGGWAYFHVPAKLLRSETTALTDLLTALAKGGERELHLLTYGWEEGARIPENTPARQETYIRDFLRMLLPGQETMLGVKLHADAQVQKESVRVRAVFTEVVDRFLAEWVPDLSVYDNDLAVVTSMVARFGLTPPEGGARNLLEGWYARGMTSDVPATENDLSVNLRHGEVLEFAAVRFFGPEAPQTPRPLISSDGQATVAVSVRGKLTLQQAKDPGMPAEPVLNETSVVFGRRAQRPRTALTSTVATLPGVETKPLPMRQVLAWSETLPCSVTRSEPNLFRVTTEHLRRVGFTDPTPVGDRDGLLLGLGSPGFAHPLYLNPFTGRDSSSSGRGHTTVVVGDHAAGKTFTAEHLTIQARLAGRRVTWISTDTTSGTGTRDLLTSTGISAGMLDPFALFPAPVAVAVFARLVKALCPALTPEERDYAVREAQGASIAGVNRLTRVIAALSNKSAAATMSAYFNTDAGSVWTAPLAPETATAAGHTGFDPATAWRASHGRRIAMRSFVANAPKPLRWLYVDVLVAAATITTTDGLLVLDHIGATPQGHPAPDAVSDALAALLANALRPGSITSQVRHTRPPGALLLTTPDPQILEPGKLDLDPTVALCLPVANTDATTQMMRSFSVPEADTLARWVARVRPKVAGGVIYSPTAAVFMRPGGAHNSISLGPVPLDWVESLTRGRATRYRADS